MNDHKYFLELSMANLAVTQEAITFHKDTIKMLEEELVEDPRIVKIAELKDQIKGLENQANNIRTEMEPEAIQLFEETGSKSLLSGLGIRVYMELEYDEKEAMEHCLDSMPALPRVDKKGFEKYAKAMADINPLPFVAISETPKIAVSSDLSAYLVPEPEAAD